MDLDLLAMERETNSCKGAASLRRDPFDTKFKAIVARGELDNENVEADLRLRTQIISAQALALSIMGAELDTNEPSKIKSGASSSRSKEEQHSMKKEQDVIALDEDKLQEKRDLADELEKAGKDGVFPVSIARAPKAYLDALVKKKLANETELKGKEKNAHKKKKEEEEEGGEVGKEEKEEAMCDVSRFKRLIRPFSFSGGGASTKVSPEERGVVDFYEYDVGEGDGGMWETDAVLLLLHDEQMEEEDVVVEEMDDEEEQEEMVINKRGGKRAALPAASTTKISTIREGEGQGGGGRKGDSVVSSVRKRMQATTTTTKTVSPSSKTSRKVASVGEDQEAAVFGLPPSLSYLKDNVNRCLALKNKASKLRRLVLKEEEDLLRPSPVHRTTRSSHLSGTAYRQFVAAASKEEEEEEELEPLRLTRLGKWPFECAVPSKAGGQLFAFGRNTIGLGFDFDCSTNVSWGMGVGVSSFGEGISIEREEVIGLDSNGAFSVLVGEEEEQWDEGMVVDVAYMPFEDVDSFDVSYPKEKEESVRKRVKTEDSIIMPVCFDGVMDQNLGVSSSSAPRVNTFVSTLPRVSIAKCQMWLKVFVKPPQESIVDLSAVCPLQGLGLEAMEEIKRRIFLALISLSEAYNRVAGQQKGKSVQLQMRLAALSDRRHCIKVTFQPL